MIYDYSRGHDCCYVSTFDIPKKNGRSSIPEYSTVFLFRKNQKPNFFEMLIIRAPEEKNYG